MNPRLQMLSQLIVDGSTDPFHHYAFANELRKERRLEEALRAYQGLRAAHPDYQPMYLMAALLLVELGRSEEAREWLSAGIELARRRGDAKTAGELADALGKV